MSIPKSNSVADGAECAHPPINSVCWLCSTSGLFTLEHFREAAVNDLDDLGTGSGFTYATTWESIHAGAGEASCNWCKLLASTKHSVDQRMQQDGCRAKEVTVRVGINNSALIDHTKVLRLIINSVVCDFNIVTSPGYTTASNLASLLATNFGHHTPGFVDYTLSAQLISQCAEHPYCQTPGPSVPPTRLIDCVALESPRLVVTNGTKESYAALSYVWGGPQSQQTTTRNIQSYLERIIVCLPNTITDAIYVTHKLGLRYLWVDALCIIQDSEEDRDTELPRMADIYANASVTLVAASARGADEGFLPDQRPSFCVPSYHLDGTIGEMMLCRMLVEQCLVGAEPVNKRAWCIQESYLASRTLSFCHPVLSFRCRSSASLVWQGQDPVPHPQDLHPLYLTNHPEVLDDDDKRSDLLTQWHNVVMSYSAGALTNPSDKLVAFAGIAEVYHRVWGGEYLAGLWKATLIEDLSWRSWSSTLHPRPTEYRAPSWSWASVDGMVMMHEDHFTLLPTISYECDIIECKVELRSQRQPFGQVTSGYIKLNAVMAFITIPPGLPLTRRTSLLPIVKEIAAKKYGFSFYDLASSRSQEVHGLEVYSLSLATQGGIFVV